MPPLEPAREIVNTEAYASAVESLRAAEIRLPTFAQLMDPSILPPDAGEILSRVDPDAPGPTNRFRVHWYNDATRKKPREGTRLPGVATDAHRYLGTNRGRAWTQVLLDWSSAGARASMHPA